MSDDDGMLLNFAAPDPKRQVKKKVKMVGGKWTDRRKTKLILENRKPVRKWQGDDDPNQKKLGTRRPRNDDIKPKGRKRRDVPSDEGETPYKRTRIEHESRGINGGKDQTYVSSLFTANPDVKARDYSQKTGIGLKPSNAPLLNDESAKFSTLGVNDQLCKSLETRLHYSKPTRIQRAVIPELLNEEGDIFVQAQTGSGKTLAFTLPIINRLMKASDGTVNRKSGIFAIILSPTRELATQTYEFLANKLCSACHWIVPGLVIGGEKKKSEKARIRKGVNILVATPGRLADHIENTDKLDLSNVRFLVLDEGDRLMDLGFEEAIKKLLDRLESVYNPVLPANLQGSLPHRRVNVLCSATMKGAARKLGEISLTDAKLITSDSSDGGKPNDELKAPEQLIQEILVVPPKLRFVTLSATLKNLTSRSIDPEAHKSVSKTIVFFSCSDSVDFHFIALTRGGKKLSLSSKRRMPQQKANRRDRKKNDEEANPSNITARTAPLINPDVVIYKLHGSLSQQARNATLSHFAKSSSSKHAILFCTDVASRGLDLPDIKNVVEFDPPFTVQDHLHRVGRTARVGSSGLSELFLLPGCEENYIKKIEPLHGSKKENLRFLDYQDVLKRAFAREPTEEEEEREKRRKKKRENSKIPQRAGNWDIHATTFQLDMERWLLAESRAKEIAVNAFVSHTRAYTTHLASERDCFNMKELHLGHLAKSFGLRETPKKLANENSKAHGKKPREDAKAKMLRMAKLAAASQSAEFNTF